MALMIDKETKERVPVTAFLKAINCQDIARLMTRLVEILDGVWMALWLMKNYDPSSRLSIQDDDLLKSSIRTFNARERIWKVGPDRRLTT